MPYDSIKGQGQGHGGQKSCESGRFQSIISSVGMHVIKRLMVNYDNPRQYLNFNRTDL